MESETHSKISAFGLKRRQDVFILGTPFSGSTLLANALNTAGMIFTAGEVNRLPAFRQFMHLEKTEPDIYTSSCFLCDTTNKSCPVWTESIVEMLEGHLISSAIYDVLAEHTSVPVVVDASKDPNWLRKLRQSGAFVAARSYVIHITKNPFSFARSWRARTGEPVWRGAEVWRDINLDAIRVTNSYPPLPYLNIKYEHFISDPLEVVTQICRFLSRPPALVLKHQTDVVHSLGGNASAYIQMIKPGESFNITDRWIPAYQHFSKQQLSGQKPKPDLRWLTELTKSNLVEILGTFGTADLAALLDYNLVDLLQQWERARD